jgi:hypothetical protein
MYIPYLFIPNWELLYTRFRGRFTDCLSLELIRTHGSPNVLHLLSPSFAGFQLFLHTPWSNCLRRSLSQVGSRYSPGHLDSMTKLLGLAQ